MNAQSTRVGAIVPSSAVTLWNVQPAQNDYARQSGRVTVAMSSATPWPTTNGVLAEFTFEVQAGQAQQYRWPVQVSGMQLTSDGYDNLPLAPAQICFIGRDPIPASLDSASGGLSGDGFKVSLTGEVGASYSIEASTNLVNWTPLVTLTNSNGSVNLVDPAAARFNQRFYRAKQQ